jgi:glycosyltransferase involved in cell wall biosynthesis
MKILHIVGTIDPAAGGPSEAIRMLIRYAPECYTSELATLDDPAAPFLRDLSFPVHALGGPKKRWHSSRFLPWLRLNRERFDGVIVHGLWEYTGLGAMRAFSGHTPYVVFAHGMLDPWFKRTFPAKHLKKWLYWLPFEYWVLRRAHRVLFTTALERDLAAQSFWMHRWRPMVVPLGSERAPAARETLLQAFDQRCPELRGKRFLLFLGRIHPKKGCDLLTEAFAELAPLHPDLHLLMAGPDPGNWRAQLEPALAAAGVADRVHWPGMLQGNAKWGAFAACEAFVLPSHQENFGIAAVEALASAKPVLLAHPVNIAPDVERAGCALVEADTLEGTRALLTRWLALSPAERHAMSDRALATFEQHYDMRHNAEAILKVFEQPSAGTEAPVSEPRAERPARNR